MRRQGEVVAMLAVAAVALCAGVVLVMEVLHTREKLDSVTDQFGLHVARSDSQMADARRMLADSLEGSRQDRAKVEKLELRLAQVLKEAEGSARRALQEAVRSLSLCVESRELWFGRPSRGVGPVEGGN